MKNIQNTLALLAVLFGGTLTSCNDEPYKFVLTDGLPTVDYVRFTSPTDHEPIDGAGPGKPICLVGSNLTSIREIYFNDEKAFLNTSFITENNLIVKVPTNFPKKINNKISLINSDTVYYDFKVLFPSPYIQSMSNEYAKPGDVVTLLGDFFLNSETFPLSVEVGGKKVTDIVELVQNKIRFKIPEGAESGDITVTSAYGTSKAPFMYKDQRGMLFDFDDDGDNALSGGHGWDLGTVGIFSSVPAIDGNYLKFEGKLESRWAWENGKFSMQYWPEGNEQYPDLNTFVDFTELDNLVLKFEVNVAREWSVCGMQIFLTTNEIVTYNNPNTNYYNENMNPQYPRAIWMPWKETGTFKSDGWMTVTIPLSEFCYDKGGKSTERLLQSAITGLTIFVFDGGEKGPSCEPIICIDNIRVVRK